MTIQTIASAVDNCRQSSLLSTVKLDIRKDVSSIRHVLFLHALVRVCVYVGVQEARSQSTAEALLPLKSSKTTSLYRPVFKLQMMYSTIHEAPLLKDHVSTETSPPHSVFHYVHENIPNGSTLVKS